MRKAILLILCLGATTARAEFMNVAAYGGYATVSFKEVNDSIEKMKVEALKNGGNAQLTPLSSGWVVGADANFAVAPFVKVGARLEHLGVNALEMKVTQPVDIKFTANPSLTSGLVGLVLGADIPGTGVSFAGALHGGYGYAAMPYTIASPTTYLNSLYVGGGFVGQATVKAAYELVSLAGFSLRFDIGGGYRYAPMTMNDGSRKLQDLHERVVYSRDKEINADYSGLVGTLGLTAGF